MRAIHHRYVDPLDQLWIDCLSALGFRLRREPGAYATTDGQGTLTIAVDEELDADDCLAQMIFHELCHAAVQGPDSLTQRDWGLDNESDKDVVNEHATLRLQAFLLRPLGLRTYLGPTTDFRAYYDALPADPFEGDDPAIPMARVALARMGRPPFAPHVGRALRATADVLFASSTLSRPSSRAGSLSRRESGDGWGVTFGAISLALDVAGQGSGQVPGTVSRAHEAARAMGVAGDSSASSELPTLARTLEPRAEVHRCGASMPAVGARAASETCGSCAWFGGTTPRAKCLSTAVRVTATDGACERWESAVHCEPCGACCREAFHTLLLSPRETFVKKHPELVVLYDGKPELPRPGGRCPPLTGDGRSAPFRCSVHEDRPKTCRDFTRGSANCLEARRRVGLSI